MENGFGGIHSGSSHKLDCLIIMKEPNHVILFYMLLLGSNSIPNSFWLIDHCSWCADLLNFNRNANFQEYFPHEKWVWGHSQWFMYALPIRIKDLVVGE